MKVVLILADGMRPDAITNIEYAKELFERSTYTLSAQTVMPSVTLPCHMSLFHSVDPSRHGTTTNMYTPQVRPIKGLCEVLKESGKRCAFFYDWEELRDLSRPSSLTYSCFIRGGSERRGEMGYIATDNFLTDNVIEYLKNNEIDFTFLYMGSPDDAGHRGGWMGDEYLDSVSNSWRNIEKVISALSDEYAIIITADHGGHDRIHGTDLAEDMNIPVILYGAPFERGVMLADANIKDIAPTVATLLGCTPDEEWEGKSLV